MSGRTIALRFALVAAFFAVSPDFVRGGGPAFFADGLPNVAGTYRTRASARARSLDPEDGSRKRSGRGEVVDLQFSQDGGDLEFVDLGAGTSTIAYRGGIGNGAIWVAGRDDVDPEGAERILFAGPVKGKPGKYKMVLKGFIIIEHRTIVGRYKFVAKQLPDGAD